MNNEATRLDRLEALAESNTLAIQQLITSQQQTQQDVHQMSSQVSNQIADLGQHIRQVSNQIGDLAVQISTMSDGITRLERTVDRQSAIADKQADNVAQLIAVVNNLVARN